MKKISLLLVLIIVYSTNTFSKSVVFTLSNGTKVYYLLGGEKNPLMTFNDNKVVVNTDEYELSDIKNFYISDTDDPTSIEQTLNKEKVSYQNNQFVVNADAKAVRVHSLNGTQVNATVTSTEGYTTIDLSNLPSGAYIINVSGASFKVLKK